MKQELIIFNARKKSSSLLSSLSSQSFRCMGNIQLTWTHHQKTVLIIDDLITSTPMMNDPILMKCYSNHQKKFAPMQRNAHRPQTTTTTTTTTLLHSPPNSPPHIQFTTIPTHPPLLFFHNRINNKNNQHHTIIQQPIQLPIKNPQHSLLELPRPYG